MDPKLMLLIIVVLLVLFIVIKINANSIRGKVGEKRVSSKLKGIKNGKVINNLTLFVSDNKTCQIDHILVCTRGIFVIETKNYAGRIYGDDSQREWTQVLNYGKVKNKFYSPVKQNNTHVYELGRRIHYSNLYNCVIFVKNNISFIRSEHVFTLNNIKRFIMRKPEIYSIEEVELIVEKINGIHIDISNRKHVRNIKQMKKDIDNNICPRCGSPLVLRAGKNGQFYGCSKFPKCKFTKRIT